MSALFRHFEHLESVGSTNDYLKQYIERGQPRVVVADQQTAGRGRHGRHWSSPRGEGLYVSYLFFPSVPSSKSPVLNQIAAVAVAELLSSLPGAGGKRIGIKPPNDLLVENRKVGGILVELSSQGDRVSWAIVGIGVNLTQQVFRLERRNLQPTSLRLEGIRSPDPEQIAQRLTSRLEHLYQRLEEGAEREIAERFEKLTISPATN